METVANDICLNQSQLYCEYDDQSIR